MRDVPYILGHSPAEIRRLAIQASLVEPITERLLRAAGLEPGMRVLDLGCGGGDVSMLLAEMVGPTGSVVGIDRNACAVAAAERRAWSIGYTNLRFHQESVEEFYDPQGFDAVVGRYVMVYQADPVRFLRAAASHARPGGFLAFHEVAMYGRMQVMPPVPLMQQVWRWLVAAYATLPHPDAPGRLLEHFHAAGLPQPEIFSEMPVSGGPDSPFYALATQALASLLPTLERAGVATAEQVGLATLEARLREAVTAANAQLVFPMQVCSWVQV
jgi:SAM-dependent methyltransferase